MKENFKRTLMITIGSILLAVGSYYFLVNNDIAAGGVTGIAMVFASIFPILTTGEWSLILNILLFIMAFWLVGKRFGINSIYSSGIVSIVLIILERISPGIILSDDMILNVIMGAVIQSIGMGLVFYYEGSTGGTDILAVIVNKYTRIPIGKSLLIIDVLVILLAGFEFGLQKALYATLTVLITSAGVDYLIQGLGRKVSMFIISDKIEEITKIILTDYDRGVTILEAEGGYSKKQKRILMTILTNRQYLDLKKEIEAIDQKAFIFTNSVSEIVGEGFTYEKIQQDEV
ncbi:MAG: YitT family protein [Tissierellia bacterium]|nr:YitT family protein [Tissierellia bacterium]